MTAVVSNPFSIQIVADTSPYTSWSIGQYQKIVTGASANYGAFANEPYPGIVAYSSAAVDTSRGRLMVMGGGHGDHGKNDVWVLDIDNPAAKWTRLNTPTYFGPTQEAEALAYADNFDRPGGYIDGTPITRHTFYSEVYLPTLDALLVGGGSTWSGGYGSGDVLWHCWPNSPCDLWLFYPATATWEFKGSALLNSGANQLPVVPGKNAYSVDRNTIYTLSFYAKSGSYDASKYGPPDNGVGAYTLTSLVARVWECSAVAGAWTWTVHPYNAPNLEHPLMAVDLANDRLVIVGKLSGARQVWVCPLATKVWARVTALSGTEPMVPSGVEGDALHYSTLTGRLLYVTAGQQALFALTLGAGTSGGTWERITPDGTFYQQGQAHHACYDSERGLLLQPVQRASVSALDVYAIKA